MLRYDALGLGSGRQLGRILALLAATFAVFAWMLVLSSSAWADLGVLENPAKPAGSPLPAPEGWVLRMENAGYVAQRVVTVSSETIALEGAVGEVPHATGIFPASCSFTGSSISCNLNVPEQEPSNAPTYTEVCYNGSPPGKVTDTGSVVVVGEPLLDEMFTNKAAGSTFGEGLDPPCGVPGWTPASSSPGSGSGGGAPGSSVPGTGTGTGTGTGGPPPAAKPKPWSHTLCKTTYKKWAKKHKHATRKQKKTEANGLHKSHGCPLSLLK